MHGKKTILTLLFLTLFLFGTTTALADDLPGTKDHTNSAELTPEWSPANQWVDYSVTLCNIGDNDDDPVDETRIYKNANYGGFDNASACEDIPGWEKTFINSKKACHYIALNSSSWIYPGDCEAFGFTAYSPAAGNCNRVWEFETRDVNEVWLSVNDTTSVDNLPPNINKTLEGGSTQGPCPPGAGEECWMTQDVTIQVDVLDESLCSPPSKIDYCEFRIELDGELHDSWIVDGDDNGEVHETITFEEDSYHELSIYCKDVAGNDISDIEVFRVDDTEPITTKTYGLPHYPTDINNGAPYPHYITTETPITLASVDPDPTGESCNIGVDYIRYRDFIVADEYCGEMGDDTPDPQTYYCNPEYYNAPKGGWVQVNESEVTFTKDEESCHVIEFYAVDVLGNEEPLNYQCVFVEEKPPVVNKEVGTPRVDAPYDLSTTGDAAAFMSAGQAYEGAEAVWMEADLIGDGTNEARIEIPLEDMTLGDIETLMWYAYVTSGYMPHVDILIDIDGDGVKDDALVVEYDKVAAPHDQLVGDMNYQRNAWVNTFDDKGIVDDGAGMWLSSGNPGPMGGPGFIYGTLADWKAGTVEPGIDASTAVLGLEIEVDGWVEASGSFVDLVKLNGVGLLSLHWVTPDTDIAFQCVDQDPHPVGQEELCFKVSYDEPEWGYITDSYCSEYGGTMENEWCCLSAMPEDEFVFNFHEDEDSVHDLEYYCRDALGQESPIHYQYYKVDSIPPTLSKDMFGSWLGDCPSGTDLEHGDCYVADNGQSGVTVTAMDGGEVCHVDQLACYYEVWWETDEATCDDHDGEYNNDTDLCLIDANEFDGTTDVVFGEDSTHHLYVYCEDGLGNWVEDEETFLVDSTPPETFKNYGEPHMLSWYPKGCFDELPGPGVIAPMGCYWAEWITSQTPVYLNATDNKVGVDKTYWRNFYIDDPELADMFCGNQPLPQLAGDQVCDGPCPPPQTSFCNPEYYADVVDYDMAWTEYTEPFFKSPESCHIIEYYSVDKLNNTENKKWQCVFVDNSAPEMNKTIGEPKVEGVFELDFDCEEQPVPTADYEPRAEPDVYDGDMPAPLQDDPCADATVPSQCAYVNATSLPPYAQDTLDAEGATTPDCGNVLLLSTGDPLDSDTYLNSGAAGGSCGTNPDGYGTNDCVILNNYMPGVDSVVLAASSEWPEYQGSSFTDWMQIFSGNVSVDISIDDWGTANIIPYGPSNTGTKTLATIAGDKSASLRVADSGDSVYDIILMVVPLGCFEEEPETLFCGDGIIQDVLGEECDDGNQQSGDGCSASCQIEEDGCDNELDVTYITKETPIEFSCQDVFPHPVDHVEMSYRYRYSDDCMNWGSWSNWTAPQDPDWSEDGYTVYDTFTFDEDSCHELEYYCMDGLGNTGPVMSEYDIVDTVEPAISTEIVGPQLSCAEEAPEAEACYKWDCLKDDGEWDNKDFQATARFGDNLGDTGGWELAIKDGSDNVGTQEHYAWTSGTPVPFSFSYDADTGMVTLEVDDRTLAWEYDAEKAFEYVAIVPKGEADGNRDTLVSGLMVNGMAYPDVFADDDYAGFRVFLSDEEQEDGFMVKGMITLFWETAPDGSGSEIPGVQFFAMNTHDPEECVIIDGVTEIHVDAVDPEPHPVNMVGCEWYYEVLDEDIVSNMTPAEPPFVITFPEESHHGLWITCWDALGNTAEHYEEYYVDHTKPYTEMNIGEPYFENDSAEWINSYTPFTLEAYDDEGPHDSGIDATYYRVTYLENDGYCDSMVEEYDCEDAMGAGEWMMYNGGNLTIDEESCHLVEYYSVDGVNKTEEVNKRCIFVDTTDPVTNKAVGIPKAPMSDWSKTIGARGSEDGEFDAYYPELDPDGEDICSEEEGKCWDVTLFTPIDLQCEDQIPHPSGATDVCFKVDWDANDVTEEYCDEGEMNDEGYCCMMDGANTFYFNESTWHKLEYYCLDNVENVGEPDIEYFKVFKSSFNITLNKKWNLISVPVRLMDDSMDAVFGPVSDKVLSVWQFDGYNWHVYTPDGNPANDDITTMHPGWGYWVLTNDEAVLTIGGDLIEPAMTPPSIPIVHGWNLIGYYDTDGKKSYEGPFSSETPVGSTNPAYCTLATLRTSMWDTNTPYLATWWQPYNGLIELNAIKSTGDQDYMDAGAGYWLFYSEPEGAIYGPSSTCEPEPDIFDFGIGN